MCADFTVGFRTVVLKLSEASLPVLVFAERGYGSDRITSLQGTGAISKCYRGPARVGGTGSPVEHLQDSLRLGKGISAIVFKLEIRRLVYAQLLLSFFSSLGNP